MFALVITFSECEPLRTKAAARTLPSVTTLTIPHGPYELPDSRRADWQSTESNGDGPTLARTVTTFKLRTPLKHRRPER